MMRYYSHLGTWYIDNHISSKNAYFTLKWSDLNARKLRLYSSSPILPPSRIQNLNLRYIMIIWLSLKYWITQPPYVYLYTYILCNFVTICVNTGSILQLVLHQICSFQRSGSPLKILIYYHLFYFHMRGYNDEILQSLGYLIYR